MSISLLFVVVSHHGSKRRNRWCGIMIEEKLWREKGKEKEREIGDWVSFFPFNLNSFF